MEKQYKLSDRVSKDSIKSPTFKKWLKRILCAVCIISLALQLTLCCIPMQASAVESYDYIIKAGTYQFNLVVDVSSYYEASLPFTFYNPLTSKTEQCIGIIVGENNFNNCLQFYTDSGSHPFVYYDPVPTDISSYYSNGWLSGVVQSVTVTSDTETYLEFYEWFVGSTNYNIVNPTDVYDFTGEYRLFNEQLTNLSFAQAGTVTQSYAFDFNIWGGYNADYFLVQADGSSVDISYAFTDEGSGGIKTVYRQLLRDGELVGTWLVPRARLIYFQSNPDDPTLQQWLLDNTVLIDETIIDAVYSFGYDNGYNDGWTNSAIGDTFKAPVEALNNIILLDIAGVSITLGGVIFTMVVLSILLIFLKKYAGG